MDYSTLQDNGKVGLERSSHEIHHEPTSSPSKDPEFVGQALLDALEGTAITDPASSKDAVTESALILSKGQRKRKRRRDKKLAEQEGRVIEDNEGSVQASSPHVQQLPLHSVTKKLNNKARKGLLQARLESLVVQASASEPTDTGINMGQQSSQQAMQSDADLGNNAMKVQLDTKGLSKTAMKNLARKLEMEQITEDPETKKLRKPRNEQVRAEAKQANKRILYPGTGTALPGDASGEIPIRGIASHAELLRLQNGSGLRVPQNESGSSAVYGVYQPPYSSRQTQHTYEQPEYSQDGVDYGGQLYNNNFNDVQIRTSANNISIGNTFSTNYQNVGVASTQFPTSFMPVFVPNPLHSRGSSYTDYRFPSMQWPQQVQDFHTLSRPQRFAPIPQQHIHSSSLQDNSFPRYAHYINNIPSNATPTPAPVTGRARTPTSPRGPHGRVIPPEPTAAYLNQAGTPPTRLPRPQNLLVVSDINGTLIYRRVGQTIFQTRPSLKGFLEHVFATHTMMIWTSARPQNVNVILDKLVTPSQRSQLVASWARDTLSLTPEQYNGKVQVYKRLESVWSDKSIQRAHPSFRSDRGKWSQSNTLLIDDSTEKARAQPYNLVNVPELLENGHKAEKAAQLTPVLDQVRGYLDEARSWSDVSAFARLRPFKVGQGWERGGSAMSPAVAGPLKLDEGSKETDVGVATITSDTRHGGSPPSPRMGIPGLTMKRPSSLTDRHSPSRESGGGKGSSQITLPSERGAR